MLYEAQLSRCRVTPGEAGGSSCNYRSDHNDLDHIAREARDIGALSEPLADSVLQYSLRQLKPGARFDRDIVQDLEKELYPKDLAQLLDCAAEDTPQSPLEVPGMNPERPQPRPMSTTFDTAATDIGTLHPPAASGDWIRGSLFPTEQGNPHDWFHLNPDGFLQPLFSYDDLFDLNFSI